MPGIGKTTSIHCLAHALLGDAYKEGVMELNASDERYDSFPCAFIPYFLLLPTEEIAQYLVHCLCMQLNELTEIIEVSMS